MLQVVCDAECEMAALKHTSRFQSLALWVSFFATQANAFLQHPFLASAKNGADATTMNRIQVASHNDEEEIIDRLDVVLYGVGDLRTDDHVGLTKAIERASISSSRILPIVVLDTKDTLPKIPGAVAHTLDTAAILSKSLESLQENLEDIGLSLHIHTGKGGFCSSMNEVLDLISMEVPGSPEIHMHVCDLGDVDHQLGYGPWSHCRDGFRNSNIQFHPWTCPLRMEPWKDVDNCPDTYPDYRAMHSSVPMKPLPSPQAAVDGARLQLASLTTMPSSDDIALLLQEGLQLDPDRCKAEENSGIYGTHWGGLDAAAVGETNVLKAIHSFVLECHEDDKKWAAHPDYVGKSCRRNPSSLEHAAISWMMKGEGTNPDPTTNNLIAGETMTRFLSAPLMFGTVSPRRLWHSSTQNSLFHTSVLKTVPESREWHNILAARNLRTDSSYQGGGGLQFGYWRWHGFLARYAKSNWQPKVSPNEKEGILLVHGFGASSAQWSKTLEELSKSIPTNNSAKTVAGLAPCLIGFGQSEKPPLTYTQYLWESYVSAFIKEVSAYRYGWDQFVVGGNSIGGYTSMGVAADDTVPESDYSFLSGSGAPGTGRCTGVVLMNSAGQIETKEMAVKNRNSDENTNPRTIAETTASGSLPACKFVPRPAARFLGNGLLGYLRPRIQSICKNLYPTNPDAVNDVLCEGILRDSLDPGAINVMISGSKLPPPRTANELLGADFGSTKSDNATVREGMWKGPVLVSQGMLDPLNDAKSRASMLRDLRNGITVRPINAGHCPHDELPKDVAMSIAQWLEATKTERNQAKSTGTVEV